MIIWYLSIWINIKIHIAAEVFYLPNLTKILDNPLVTIGDGKFMLMIGNPIYPDNEFSSRKKKILEMTKKMNEELEKLILQFPEQYLWSHDRWKIK